MPQLSEDKNFHYEAIRSLGLAPYGGCDVNETLAVLSRIRPGDVESCYSPVTLRNVYFRVSHYIFNADFFLHGNPNDTRLNENFKLWRKYFDKANALLSIPGVHARVDSGNGFSMPLIIYRAERASSSTPKPTLLIGGGFDSNMEETLHVFGFPALERGYNIILYECPGQPSLLQEQSKGFIPDWEKAVTPIIDYIHSQSSTSLSFIDTSKIGLVGMSLGGYLAVRAAAFEPRLAAPRSPIAKEAWPSSDQTTFSTLFDSPPTTTGRRWLHDQLKYSMQKTDGFEAFQEAQKFNCRGWLESVKMPTFVGDAKDDIFFEGQPQQVAREIGLHATVFEFNEEQAAQNHCSSGANLLMNNVILEWFAKVTAERE